MGKIQNYRLANTIEETSLGKRRCSKKTLSEGRSYSAYCTRMARKGKIDSQVYLQHRGMDVSGLR